MPIIEVNHVSKVYPSRRGRRAMLGRGGIEDWIRGRKGTPFQALQDVSLTVEPGESLGIIGRNGSGKSTLLKILAGVTLPSAGDVVVRGRVASLLELGAGFHPMLTGRENIYLNAGLLGLRHNQVDGVFDEIVTFSGMARFIDQPVDTYSSGMYVRIGFAVAAHIDPDIFLVDEVLAVGDEEFQRKCRQKIGELRERGKTIVFVSHDLGTVHSLCHRIVLLNQGRAISREGAQATIDYYLRQIGQESGIHTLREGDVEVIFSNGRVSLFRGQKELTAPQGVYASLLSLGATHDSAAAEWRVTKRDPGHCLAETTLSRLPVRLIWDLRLTDQKLEMRLSVQCLQPVNVELVSVCAYLPSAYETYYYGDIEGAFPAILPEHVDWHIILPPEAGCLDAALLAPEDSQTPPFALSVSNPHPLLLMHLQNSDYVTGARVVHAGIRIPQSDLPLPQAVFDLGTFHMDLGLRREEVLRHARQRASQRSLDAGHASARLMPGCIEIAWNKTPITAHVHLHTQVLLANLWTMSHVLQWSGMRREQDTLRATGESPRFPFRQHWTLHAEPACFVFQVFLEALQPLDLQEYNVSIGLAGEYAHWASDSEQGSFPSITPEHQTWRHLNHDYGACKKLAASGAALPEVSLEPDPGGPAFHLTAINMGYYHQGRVLQAVRSPEQTSSLHFDPGHHLLFAGRIRIGTEST